MKTILIPAKLAVLGLCALFSSVIASQAVPLVSLEALTNRVAEGSFTYLRVQRNESPSAPLVVRLLFAGTATRSVDYQNMPEQVVIPPGVTGTNLLFRALTDTATEETETAEFTVATGTNTFQGVAYVYDSANAFARIEILNGSSPAPTINLVSPTNGSMFTLPVEIPLYAQVSSTTGVEKVEFYRGDVLLGALSEPTDGTYYRWAWTNPPAGSHGLKAKVYTAAQTNASAIRTITVTNGIPLLTLTAPVSQITETNDGSFKLARDRNFDAVLTVSLAVSGTASNGVDYTFLSNTVTFPSGATNVSLPVHPLADNLAENPETVVLTLVSNTAYRYENSGQTATVTISNVVFSSVSLTSPSAGGVYGAGANILLQAAATAPAGVQKVEFYRGDVLVGTATGPSSNVTAVVYAVTWANAAIGTHTFTAKLYDLAGGTYVSEPRTITVIDNLPALGITLTRPTNGSVLSDAQRREGIRLEATVSPVTNVLRVEFYRNQALLGTGEPGANVGSYFLVWSNAAAGSHGLQAKVYDTFGRTKFSTGSTVTVLSNAVPLVTVTALDTQIRETTNSGRFRLVRSVGAELGTPGLTAFFTLTGSASNGVDYAYVSNSVTFSPGETSRDIYIRPVADGVEEVPEWLTLTLVTNTAYRLETTNRAATMTIVDAVPETTNQLPTVSLIAPTNGAVYLWPASLTLQAQAADADGSVTRVDFYANNALLGSVSNAPYMKVWTNASVAAYTLTAKAVDNRGGTRVSSAVQVTVKTAGEPPTVQRYLPAWYVPGVKLIVTLRSLNASNTPAYYVTDLPPAGWTVGTVSTNGIYDPADGKVKFSVAAGQTAQSFSYQLTPPTDATGEKHFTGAVYIGGRTNGVAGVSALNPAPSHPGDLDPADLILSAGEVDAYAAAWRNASLWTVSPNPVPVNYVTRAGYLLSLGGAYQFSTNYPSPAAPLLWVAPGLSETPVLSTANAPEAGWLTNGVGTAVAAMATNYVPGVPVSVTITVTPATNARVWAVEDRPPVGSTVTNISSGGVFSPLTGKVRWGLFDATNTGTLSYQVILSGSNAPAVAEFAGVASFDGINVPITGGRKTRRATSVIAPARLNSIEPLADGQKLVTFQGEPGVAYTVEATTNLTEWNALETLLNNDGTLQYIDLSTNAVLKFYRAVPNQ